MQLQITFTFPKRTATTSHHLLFSTGHGQSQYHSYVLTFARKRIHLPVFGTSGKFRLHQSARQQIYWIHPRSGYRLPFWIARYPQRLLVVLWSNVCLTRRTISLRAVSGRKTTGESDQLSKTDWQFKTQREVCSTLSKPKTICQSGHESHKSTQNNFLSTEQMVKTIYWFQYGTKEKANDDFEKNYFKLINNAVVGKTLESLGKYQDVKLVPEGRKFKKLVAKSNFKSF